MTKELMKWADSAMFEAEPMTVRTPKVHLIGMTPDPLGALAAAAKMYKGEVVRSLAEVTDEERLSYFTDLTKTTLNAAFETIDFHFMIEGVTRGFTHQLVRQRTAVYFQESTRFAVVDDLAGSRVGLPPSLQGTMGLDQFRQKNPWIDHEDISEGSPDYDLFDLKQRQRNKWDEAMQILEEAYGDLVRTGVPAEDARGLLPTNLLTFIHYKTNLRNLIDHAGMRLCTQAQFEWRYVFSEIARAIRNAQVYVPNGEGFGFSAPVYMADQISDRLFRPVCYQTGNCAFLASFDRHCQIRERVLANHAIGRNSSEWARSWSDPDDPNDSVTIGAGVGYKENGSPTKVNAIHPAEWMLDPSAARQ